MSKTIDDTENAYKIESALSSAAELVTSALGRLYNAQAYMMTEAFEGDFKAEELTAAIGTLKLARADIERRSMDWLGYADARANS